MAAMALLDRDGVYGSPRFHLAAKKISIRAHIGAEVTSADGWRYPVAGRIARGIPESLPLDHAHEIARAKKAKAMFLPEEIAEERDGPDLPDGRRGRTAGACAGAREESKAATACVEQLCELFGRENVYVELQRHFCREEEARNQAALEIARKLQLPLLATNGVCYAQPQQREAAGRLHLHPPSPHAGIRRAPAGAQFRAPFEIARGNGALVFRSSRSHRQHARSFLAPAIHLERSGLRISEISGSGWRIANAFSARAHAGKA